MKRTGFSESFDKERLVDTATAKFSSLEQTYHDEVATKKEQLLSNIIEFCIGAILLVFCYFYLQTHPAEKVSMFVGVQVMREKTMLWVKDLSGQDTNLLEQKLNLEKTMQEIVFMAEQNSCIDITMRKNIEESYQKVKAMDLETYKKQHKAYESIAGLYYKTVRAQCDK